MLCWIAYRDHSCYTVTRGNPAMLPPFDIFRDLDGYVYWVEAASTLDNAKARVRILMVIRPAAYVIFSQRTTNKIFLKPGDSEWSDVQIGKGTH